MDEYTKFVHQAKLGDAGAFAQLYREVYQDLYRFALYTLRNSHDAEDAVSEAVTDGWAQIGSLRKETSFRCWMFKILSNKCRQRLKKYLDKTQELPEDLLAASEDLDQSMDVRAAFFRLEEQDRFILSLHIFGGYSSREIGEILGINDNTVRSRQKRALEKMGHYLKLA